MKAELNELRADILHRLRSDHGHTTANDAQLCKTCLRRTDEIMHVFERWTIQHGLDQPAVDSGTGYEEIAAGMLNHTHVGRTISSLYGTGRITLISHGTKGATLRIRPRRGYHAVLRLAFDTTVHVLNDREDLGLPKLEFH